MGCLRNDESLWWYIPSGEELLCGGKNWKKKIRKRQGKLKINSWEHLLKKMQIAFLPHTPIRRLETRVYGYDKEN
jgi:hypothetical protein